MSRTTRLILAAIAVVVLSALIVLTPPWTEAPVAGCEPLCRPIPELFQR